MEYEIEKKNLSNLQVLKIGEYEIIVQVKDNHYYAFSGVCPHLGGALKLCQENKDSVVCPWHGYIYNLNHHGAITPISPWGDLPRRIDLNLKKLDLIILEHKIIVKINVSN